MVWLPINEFCQATKMSRVGVDKKVKENKLEKKLIDGKQHIGLDLSEDRLKQLIPKDQHSDENKLIGSLLVEYKENLSQFREEMQSHSNRMSEAHDRELSSLKESKNEVIQVKDDEIERLKKELEKLGKKGFFRKFFGG